MLRGSLNYLIKCEPESVAKNNSSKKKTIGFIAADRANRIALITHCYQHLLMRNDIVIEMRAEN